MSPQYFLQERLGQGGYSNVYRCIDEVGIRYACKVIPKNNNKRNRVQNELQVLHRLTNALRVVRLVDAREDDVNYYIIQELCKGGVIRDYVSKHDMYGENTVASIIRGTLRGLHHVHEHGIVHRDIKGSNIMLTDTSADAEIRLIDFGAAMQLSSGIFPESTDDLVGTPWFMAPESLGYKFGPKSDVWSVGVLTYQLLSGRMPFNDQYNPSKPSMVRMFKSIYVDNPQMSGIVWENISQDAKNFVSMCLQKEYVARPSAKEALSHPWLTSTDCADRFRGAALSCSPFVYEGLTGMNAVTHHIVPASTRDVARFQP